MDSPSPVFSKGDVVGMCLQALDIKPNEVIPRNMLIHGAFVIHAMGGHDNCKSALNEWSETCPENSKRLEQYLAILERYATFYNN
jgi:hypothetical protein